MGLQRVRHDLGAKRIKFSSITQSHRLFATPWTAAHQASRSITNSWSLLKLMSIELVMPSNPLILYRPLLLPPSIFPSIRVFPSESALRIRWPEYWSFSFSISPSNEHPGLISFRIFSHKSSFLFIWKHTDPSPLHTVHDLRASSLSQERQSVRHTRLL